MFSLLFGLVRYLISQTQIHDLLTGACVFFEGLLFDSDRCNRSSCYMLLLHNIFYYYLIFIRLLRSQRPIWNDANIQDGASCKNS